MRHFVFSHTVYWDVQYMTLELRAQVPNLNSAWGLQLYKACRQYRCHVLMRCHVCHLSIFQTNLRNPSRPLTEMTTKIWTLSLFFSVKPGVMFLAWTLQRSDWRWWMMGWPTELDQSQCRSLYNTWHILKCIYTHISETRVCAAILNPDVAFSQCVCACLCRTYQRIGLWLYSCCCMLAVSQVTHC